MAPGLFWIRCEAFDHAVFNTSVRWTASKVQEFIVSLQASVPGTSLEREGWIEAATQRCKPALTQGEAVAYWEVFSAVDSASTEPTRTMDIRSIGLLMLCQVFVPHRGRADNAMMGDVWLVERAPGASSPRASPRGSSPRGAAARVGSGPSAAHSARESSAALLSFVRQNLSLFLQIACASPATEPAVVSAEDFDVLRLILCAGSSLSRPLMRLSQGVQSLAGSPQAPFEEVKCTVHDNLVWNDELYSVEQPQGARELGVPRVVHVTGQTKSTWFQEPTSENIDVLGITGCSDCTIYVTGAARFCFISGCHDCTIVAPAVSGICSVQHCERLSVHVAARCFKLENSIDATVFVYCLVPPILSGDSRGVKLAPFNVLYSQLGRVLADATLKLDPNFVDTWAHPVCCTLGAPDETLRSTNFDDTAAQGNLTYHFVHPDTFHPIVVPEFDANAKRREPQSALVLPQVYDDAVKRREEEMLEFQRRFAEISDETKKTRAMQAIQGHFREWLQSTGKSRQLVDLAKLVQQEHH